MRRRDLIRLIGWASTVWPMFAMAQQGERTRRVAVLSGFPDNVDSRKQTAAFLEQLNKLGWIQGNTLAVDIHFTGGDAGRIRALSAELIRSAPDAILAATPPVLASLQKQTRSIPIVFVNVSDPVEGGFVANMARPGGNITGFTSLEYSLGGKWVELLMETVASLARVLVLLNRENYTSRSLLSTIEAAAHSVGIQVTGAPVRNASDIEAAIDAFGDQPPGAVIVLPDPVTTVNADRLIMAATRHRLPTLQTFRWFVARGGLMSYGTNDEDLYRRVATYMDRILRGAKPAELPIQNPAKYDLTINLKTAKSLGLTMPQALVSRADEVIE